MAEVVARDEKFVREYEPREQALEEFEQRRRLHEDALRDQVHGARLAGELLSQRQVCGLLPRAARAFDGPREGGEGDERWPARTGWATRRIRSCSASMGRRFSRRRTWTSTLRGWKRRRKRDHRVLGKQLDLFSIQELAGAGLIFWHPKGAHDPQGDGRLDARGVPAARLPAGVSRRT